MWETMPMWGAYVGDHAYVGVHAYVGDHAYVGVHATVKEDTKPIIIYIVGSKFPVSYWGEDRIDIGCKSHSISDWFENYENIAKQYNFTDVEIEEYLIYCKMIQQIHNRANNL
jgi:hypothetical protein